MFQFSNICRKKPCVPQSDERGVITLEILLALVIMTLTLTAVTVVLFGTQTVSVDSETHQTALYKAVETLEEARAAARRDFSSVDTILPIADGIYTKSMTVLDVSPCLKRVTSDISWLRDTRSQLASLSTFLSDPASAFALGGDCDPIGAVSDWDSPTSYSISDPIHSGSKGTGIDVVKHPSGRFAIMTSTKVGVHDALWVINVTDPQNPTLVGSYNTSTGLNKVDAYVSASGLVYVFVVADSTTEQLQIFEIDFADPIDIIKRIAVEQLPNIDPAGDAPEGISIYYHNDRVYVGTKRTGGIVGPGHEFHVYNVSNPSSPSHLGSVELNHNVHDIVVRGNYAYIASSAEFCELTVIDVSVPGSMSNPCPAPPIPPNATVFDAPDSGGNHPDGSSVYVTGNRVYLGREQSGSIDNFLILNTSDLTNIQLLGSINLNLSPAASKVVGLYASGGLAFVVTNDTTPTSGGGPFMVFNVDDPSNIFKVSCNFNYSEKATDFDFIDNLSFVSNESNDALRIIYDGAVCS